MNVNSVFYPIADDTPGRPILADGRLAPERLVDRGDWAGAFVSVPEPWLSAAPDGPCVVLPESTAEVMVEEHPRTGDGTEPSVHLILNRNPAIRGAAGTVVVTLADAAEALHLGRLLTKAAGRAFVMSGNPRKADADG